MRTTKMRSKLSLLFIALAAMIAIPAVAALADDISNSLDASIDTVAEQMPLTTGGADGSTTLYVKPQNGDNKNGCNLTGSTSLTLAVTSSNTSVATVSPSSVTFNSCGDTPTLTVHPVAQGSADISVSQTSNNTGATFNLAPATFTVNVSPPPNTAPSVLVGGVDEGGSYNKGSVPAATCDVTDAEDGNSSFPATLSAITGPYASDGIGSQTASCSYTDEGDLTATASETYSIVDPSPPVIGYTLNPATPDGSNGWYKGNVTLTWTVSEPQSPNSLIKTGCVNQNITADQAATTYKCSATSAGGTADEQSVTIKRDATKPTISGSASPAPNGNGWNNEDVAVSFECDDNLSGVASCGPDETLSSEGSDQSVTGTATDNAGNSDTAIVSGIDIDKTPPSAPAASFSKPLDYDPTGTNNDWYKDSVTVSYGGSTDNLSGVAGYSLDQAFSTSGTHNYSGKATDNADNESAATTGSVKVDATDPTFGACPTAGPFTKGSGSQSVGTITADDAHSGLNSAGSTLSGSVDTSTIGSKTVTFTAKDNVGHEVTKDCSYNVIFNWSGFFQPVDNLPTVNTVKAGSAIPVKFSLGGNQGLSIFEAGYPKSQVYNCTSSTPTDAIEQTLTAGGSSLSYDAATGQYNYVWKTDKAWGGQCRELIVKLIDGTEHRAKFQLTR